MKNKQREEKWIYESKCCRCGKLNGWIFNPNHNKPSEKEIAFHQAYHDEHPFEIKSCEHCNINTRQEWVCLYEKSNQ